MQEQRTRSRLPSNWTNHWMEQHSWNNGGTSSHDERSDKILEIDTWKPTRRRDHKKGREHSKMGLNPSISSEEVSSVEMSPRVHSTLSGKVRGSFTPTRSECCRSLFGDYLGHPNFMANTESSRAKVRSQSAPRQRMQLDGVVRSSTFGDGVWDSNAVSDRTGYVRRHGTPAAAAAGYRL